MLISYYKHSSLKETNLLYRSGGQKFKTGPAGPESRRHRGRIPTVLRCLFSFWWPPTFLGWWPPPSSKQQRQVESFWCHIPVSASFVTSPSLILPPSFALIRVLCWHRARVGNAGNLPTSRFLTQSHLRSPFHHIREHGHGFRGLGWRQLKGAIVIILWTTPTFQGCCKD